MVIRQYTHKLLRVEQIHIDHPDTPHPWRIVVRRAARHGNPFEVRAEFKFRTQPEADQQWDALVPTHQQEHQP